MGLVFLVLLTGAPLSAAVVGIGNLQLSNSYGFQEVSFFNYTGIDQGCQVNGSPGEYPVCTGVDIASWALTITFTDPGGSLGNSLEVTFTGTDNIGPFDGMNPFTGGLSGTWQIPLSFGTVGEPPCPPCDYQITKIEFSGMLSAVDVPFELGQWVSFDPGDFSTYTIFNAQLPFDSVWTVPSTDYSNLDPAYDGAFLLDSNDVLVSDQLSPEPGSLFLMAAGLAAIGFMKRILNCRRPS
jgi:hypothetical protein